MTAKDLDNKKINVDVQLEISSKDIKERILRRVSENYVFSEEELKLFVEIYIKENMVSDILENLKITIQ